MIDEEDIETQQFPYYVSVHFENGAKNYYFGTTDPSLAIGDRVVVETASGTDLAIIVIGSCSTQNFHSPFPMAPVLRKANKDDERDYALALKEGASALLITKEEIARLGLPMNLMDARYNLEGTKCTITYTADNRVDFRELLKILAPLLHARIDLRQIAPRDKAKKVGGMGSCGLPLCCNTFLDQFEGIGIARAKNQMLSLNVPKLSGSCGKLKCCLAFEDDLYTEEKKRYPRIGSTVRIKHVDYRVDGFNIISETIKLGTADSVVTMTLDEFNEAVKPRPAVSETPTPSQTAHAESDSSPKQSEQHDFGRQQGRRRWHGHNRGNNSPKGGNNDR